MRKLYRLKMLSNLRLSWTSDLASLKMFVEDNLNLQGTWSSPVGEKKLLLVEEKKLLLLLLLLYYYYYYYYYYYFGLNILPVSVKFIQCQTVLRNALKTSPNESIKQLWKSTNQHTNIQYDVYNSTKEVLKEFHSVQKDKLKHHLICQGSFFSNVAKFSLLQLNSLWSTAQSKLPRNIFNFTVRYINSSLPTRKNLTRWGLSFSPECSFCLCPETLLHVVAGCQSYLQRFTWRHDSILNFIPETLQTTCAGQIHGQIYADLPGFRTPSIISGDAYRPDLLLITPDDKLYCRTHRWL